MFPLVEYVHVRYRGSYRPPSYLGSAIHVVVATRLAKGQLVPDVVVPSLIYVSRDMPFRIMSVPNWVEGVIFPATDVEGSHEGIRR
jgi:hypothetical protein